MLCFRSDCGLCFTKERNNNECLGGFVCACSKFKLATPAPRGREKAMKARDSSYSVMFPTKSSLWSPWTEFIQR